MAKFVDADKLMDSLTRKKSGIANQRYTDGFNDALMRFRSMLHSASSADVVEVVHGRWIESYQPLGFDEVKCAECSSCGEDWIIDEDECIYDYIAHWKYCPNCGAKMDGKGG